MGLDINDDNHFLEYNLSDWNDGNGFSIVSSFNTLRYNHAEHNNNDGFEIDGDENTLENNMAHVQSGRWDSG